MSKFTLNDFKVNNESRSSTEGPQSLTSKNISDVRIVKIDNAEKPVIKDYVLGDLNKKNQESGYSQVKAKYGALAITDIERDHRAQKDRRFSINPLLRDPLSIEQEERRIIGERVRSRVDSLADEAKAQASAVGYEEGLKQGFSDAFKKVTEEGKLSLDRFEALLKNIDDIKHEIFRANERFLMEVIFRIARMVTLKELEVDEGYLLRLTKELVSRVGVKDNITLKINSEESKTIESLKEGLKKNFGEMYNLNIESSPDIPRGGCHIETEWNTIDAKINTQLEGIYKGLMGESQEGVE